MPQRDPATGRFVKGAEPAPVREPLALDVPEVDRYDYGSRALIAAILGAVVVIVVVAVVAVAVAR